MTRLAANSGRLYRSPVMWTALVAALAVTAVLASDAPAQRPATYSYDWYEGADEFGEALEEAREEGRAIAVYFYTDWCGYCRQLERELLYRGKVEGYLKYLTKIRINPEAGRDEQMIANRYGVRGFPAFFIHPSADSGPTKIGRMKRVNGEWRLKSPDEFIETLRDVVGDERQSR